MGLIRASIRSSCVLSADESAEITPGVVELSLERQDPTLVQIHTGMVGNAARVLFVTSE